MYLQAFAAQAYPRYAYYVNNPNYASYSVSQGEQPFISPSILGFDRQWHSVKMLADTGNDVTLLMRSTALEMGIDPVRLNASTFPVSGISGGPAHFKEVKTLVAFTNLRPTWVTVGLAQREEDLVENLLGRKDLLDTGKYEFVFDEDSVDIREKHINVNLSNGYNEWGTGTPELPTRIRETMAPIRNTDLI